ncbi:hypothetical protein XU18_0130 [Perkinsela sp. CCAP 1560/4]|nr:hypothetical protein XU18_0130 [Perkinsela sp. CCAP 1560/4]|eukprot:KNH09445.1 hypothetical protein XU18_0130 [Perkinsela sp. CCAP 1560/4]
MSSSCIPLCAILLALIFQVHHVYALTTRIEPGQKECFTEKIEANIPITFQFQVVKGGKMDLEASVEEADGSVVQSWSMEADGRWSKRPGEEKSYAFCFSNKHSKWTPKWVNFHVYKYDHKNILPSAQDLDPIETSIMKLNGDFEELQESQLLIRSLEKDHRRTVESTSRHLLLWCIFDSLIVLVGGLLQLYFTRRFLNMHT